MKIEKLTAAIATAERFLETARAARDRIKTDSFVTMVGCKETAACRRASMDLTRALADLRRHTS